MDERNDLLGVVRAGAVPVERRKRGKEPSVATMERWARTGAARATDGCKVELDGECGHGCKSWVVVLGFI